MNSGYVHNLDLPWTSARLAQRVGRLARVGSRHAVVIAYTLRPPPRTEAILRSTGIIQQKAALAARLLGAESDAAAPVTWLGQTGARGVAGRASVECAEELRIRLEPYAIEDGARRAAARGPVLVARCVAPAECAVVACVIDDAPRLLAVDGGHVETRPAAVLAMLDVALAAPSRVVGTDTGEVRRVLDVVTRWYRLTVAARDAGVDLPVSEQRVRAAMSARRRAIGRLDGAAAASPFARRDAAAARAADLRAAAAQSAPIGLEQILYADDGSAFERLRTPRDRASDRQTESASELRVVALLLLGPSG